jgi:hypothetical protein
VCGYLERYFWPLVTVQTTYPKYDVGVRELHCDDAILSAPIMFLGVRQNYSDTRDVVDFFDA